MILILCGMAAIWAYNRSEKSKYTSTPMIHTVTIYTTEHKEYVEPLIKEFSAQSKLLVKCKYFDDDNKLRETALQYPPNIIWLRDINSFTSPRYSNLFVPIDGKLGVQFRRIFRNKNFNWIGFEARPWGIVYRSDKLQSFEAPTSFFDLAKNKWKGKAAIPKMESTPMSEYMKAIEITLGKDASELFLSKITTNCIVVKNSLKVIKQIQSGKASCGLVDYDDYNDACKTDLKLAFITSDQIRISGDDLGSMLVVSGLAIAKRGGYDEDGRAFCEYLLNKKHSSYLQEHNIPRFSLNQSDELDKRDWIPAALLNVMYESCTQP